MKRGITLLAVLLGVAIAAPALRAQNHVEFGAFGEYYRLSATDSNFAGLGGRFAFNFTPSIQLEAEMGYDFSQIFTYNNGVTVQNSHVSVLHGLLGPKIQTKGRVKLFATVKGGFVNFRLNPQPGSFSSFSSSVTSLTTSDVDATFYPGVGAEAFIGPIGLRVEAGDEIYFVPGGPRNNLKISFGPTFRF